MLKISIIALTLISVILCQYKDIPAERVFKLDSSSKNGDIFTIEKDQEFTFKIRGNPTTGYGWYLAEEIQEDESLLATNLSEDRSTKNYEVDNHSEFTMGVGGYFYFNFKGQRQGTYPLIFVHKRPWENESIDRKEIIVAIKDKQ